MEAIYTVGTYAEGRDIRNEDGDLIGTSYGWIDGSVEDGTYRATEEAMANAKLWAAAPSLAEALQTVDAEILSGRTTHLPDYVILIVRCALDKAGIPSPEQKPKFKYLHDIEMALQVIAVMQGIMTTKQKLRMAEELRAHGIAYDLSSPVGREVNFHEEEIGVKDGMA